MAVLVAGPAGPAAAHTTLESTVPEDGARVAAAPRSVLLTFSGTVAPGALAAVSGPGGDRRNVEPQVDGPRVTVPVPEAGPGTYRVGYRVVSRDGHPVTGELTYTVLPAANAPGPATSTPAPPPGTTPSGTAAPGTPAPGGRTSGTAQAAATIDDRPLAATGGSEGDGGIPALAVVWLGVGVLALGGAAVALAVRRRGD